MNEAETVAFLMQRGVARLPQSEWRRHQPVLCVLEDAYRGEDGPLVKQSPDPRYRPSIVRIDDPMDVGRLREHGQGESARMIFDVVNDGGRINFFAIDPKTEQPIWISSQMKQSLYQVRPENLFAAADELFPRDAQ